MKGLLGSLALTLLFAACGGGESGEDVAPAEAGPDLQPVHEGSPPPKKDGPPAKDHAIDRTPVPDSPPPVKAVTVVIAADIAEKGRTAHARTLAGMITKQSPAVSAVILGGDNARFNGLLSFPLNLQQYYNTYYKQATEADWGRFDPIAFPQSGNHEYIEGNAKGYYDYYAPRMSAIKALPGYHGFVEVVGKGYYSFDLNGWHFVSINSNTDLAPGGVQHTWYKADLAAHATMPIIAVWHAPRFTCPGTGGHGDAPEMQPFWADLYDVGGDFVFVGHNHFYQRYKPLDKGAPAKVDAAKGVTEIVVGSTGVSSYPVCDPPDPRIEKQIGTDAGIGVFYLTIKSDGSYSFEYRLENGTLFDSGSGLSHHHP